jgi:polyisoprenoid-binding protein YceI
MQALALMLAAALATPGALAAPAIASAEPALYTLDPASSFVHFELLHFGTSTIRGRIGPVQGQVLMDRQARRGELSLRIDTTTLSTGLGIFDARIRQADLLATEAYPEAYFVASSFRFDGPQLAEVRGEFTLRGVSQPLSLQALRFACRTEKDAEVCGGDFEAELLRSDFGATFGLPFIANRVRLQVQVEARRPVGALPQPGQN